MNVVKLLEIQINSYSNRARLYRQWRKIVFDSATNSLGGKRGVILRRSDAILLFW